MKKISVYRAIIPAMILIAAASFAYGQGDAPALRRLIVFYSPQCHRCIETKNNIMPGIEKKFSGKILVEYLDIENVENYKLLLGLEKSLGMSISSALPVFYFEGSLLSGEGKVGDRLTLLISRSLKLKAKETHGALPSIDLIARFKSFEPIAVVSAGLLDGINPCAFTVIVFFISFLAFQGYRKRELIAIGLMFIAAVFLTYLLIGVGIFGFLYRLKSFWLVARIFNVGIGICCVALGALALYDFFKFKKTGKTEGLVLQLPAPIKNQIHSIIGQHYRINPQERNQPGDSPRKITKLILSAFITGFLVSILEAVCTGQVYLPTITFVMKASPLKLQALGYLLLYNLMFIAPLFAIFVLALLGTTSEQFSRFLKKNILTVKIMTAVLFFGLGAFLIWKG